MSKFQGFSPRPNMTGYTKIGEENGNSKLTEKEVIEIKTRLLNKHRGLFKELAKEYNVSYVTIKHISQGRLWKWVGVE
jgi:hypothetical protein